MGNAAIQVRGLGKRYQLGALRSIDRELKEVITKPFRRIVRRRANAAGSAVDHQKGGEDFWALRDVSFELAHGEVLGVIGRNGAGKSTLLKILSRIADPTEGEARIYGRVGSLLEVGTGFHPELTGRENIFLNGAIIGMPRAEIKRRFDEIVEFSGVGRFLETPVKRYSSGMTVRLAFAVAAHLEPEILIVDEVLAVGDAEFQKKCLGKMEDVSKEGRTILFVSHNMGAVADLCSRALWLENGSLKQADSPARVIGNYLSVSKPQLTAHYRSQGNHDTHAIASVESAEILDSSGTQSNEIQFREPFSLRLAINSQLPLSRLTIAVRLFDENGKFLTAVNTATSSQNLASGDKCNTVSCTISNNVLMPGIYRMDILLLNAMKVVEHLEQPLSFLVLNYSEFDASRCAIRTDARFVLDGCWSVEEPNKPGKVPRQVDKSKVENLAW